jgi:signal transduction histidine kinase
VDGFEVERRRIERDLHDGAQQRLVALSMQLGLARLKLPADRVAAVDGTVALSSPGGAPTLLHVEIPCEW